MKNYNKETENLLNRMENYINNNRHWFCVGQNSLIQITKDPVTNIFMIRTNDGDYDVALENFLNDEEILFNDWSAVSRNDLYNIIEENRKNIEFQYNNFM